MHHFHYYKSYFFITVGSMYFGSNTLKATDFDPRTVNLNIKIYTEYTDYKAALQRIELGVVTFDETFRWIKDAIVQRQEVYKKVGEEVYPITSEDIDAIYIPSKFSGAYVVKGQDTTIVSFWKRIYPDNWKLRINGEFCIKLKEKTIWYNNTSQDQSSVNDKRSILNSMIKKLSDPTILFFLTISFIFVGALSILSFYSISSSKKVEFEIILDEEEEE